MSSSACPSCGTAHGPAQRYCLGCGALVGRRPVDLDAALAARADHARAGAESAAAPDSAAGPTPVPVSVWRRPTTSVATVLALATGVTAGFFLEPSGGAAGSAPVVVSGLAAAPSAATTPADAPAAATPTAAPAPDAAPAAEAPTADAADAGAAAPAPTDAPAGATDVAAAPAAGDAVPGPTGADATPQAAADPAPAKATKPATKTPRKTSATADGAKDDRRTRAEAAGLPRIDHVWVVGIGAPVTAREGGYLGETLLARGTELPKYAPADADLLAGAAALVAGAPPSAKASTIADGLAAAKRSWRVYGPGAPSCADAPGVNPFLAFASVTGAADCADHVAGLSALAGDVASAGDTPAFSYVATDPALDPAGLDAQLQEVVEPIRRSAAYERAGLIAIVPTAANPVAPTGALLLSPFAAGSTAVGTKLGPYSLLRTFADLLGVDRPGHAADDGVRALGPDVLTPAD